MKKVYKLEGKLWIWRALDGQSQTSAWHFISIPKGDAEKIRETFKNVKRGWGSLPVSVTLGKTTWQTSIFPDKRSSTYLLPMKAEVRRAEDIHAGDTVRYTLTFG